MKERDIIRYLLEVIEELIAKMIPPDHLHIRIRQEIEMTTLTVSRANGPINDVPAWSINNPAVAVLTPSSDGLTCDVGPGSASGSAVVTVASEGLSASIPVFSSVTQVQTPPPDTLTITVS